ncbi:MAG: phosphodiester glycosidase family protein [Chloroflexi bacterium]|uniref:phosphodiester glycosidase family protein n=1 Tax=Candidatus Flexifilum breve TaxID=3140694 RepID=UPI0031354A75|nr:phosphodiester glycosidase family protein [Chloroflexota bacterium]
MRYRFFRPAARADVAPQLSLLITAMSLMTGCTLSAQPPPPTATTPPTAAPIPTLDTSGWEVLANGLERRLITVTANTFSTLTARAAHRSGALYVARALSPGEPLTLGTWREVLPGAVAFVNANFFDTAQQALGLVVSDGVAYGQSFTDRGGMLQVQNGVPRVRSILQEPYYGEALEQAVQGFPVLVANGQTSFTNTQGDRASRRTIVAQDANGRILLLTTPSLFGMRLVDLSAGLPATDLNLVTAVNLDGGGSTMMWIGGNAAYQLYSFDPVPAVLAVYPR